MLQSDDGAIVQYREDFRLESEAWKYMIDMRSRSSLSKIIADAQCSLDESEGKTRLSVPRSVPRSLGL
jgi:hypothetical protein